MCIVGHIRSPATRKNVASTLDGVARNDDGIDEVNHAPRRRLRGAALEAQAMCGLREVLASMDKAERRAAIGDLPPDVRGALLAHMERSAACCGRKRVADSTPSRRPRVAAQNSGERGVLRDQGGWYRAQATVMCLRFQCPRQRFRAAAETQQAALWHLRRALLTAAAEDPAIWLRAGEVSGLAAKALEQCRARSAELGLSVMVHLRATKFLGQRVQIVSPVLPLLEAARLQARLLRARGSGWEAFRAVWMQLLTMRKHRHRGAVTLEDAREIADGARRRALRAQCAQAVKRSRRVLRQGRGGRRVLRRCLLEGEPQSQGLFSLTTQ
jgi:hypothetical protein